jgi:hypothetical protein
MPVINNDESVKSIVGVRMTGDLSTRNASFAAFKTHESRVFH